MEQFVKIKKSKFNKSKVWIKICLKDINSIDMYKLLLKLK